jgi:hypothetical protein
MNPAALLAIVLILGAASSAQSPAPPACRASETVRGEPPQDPQADRFGQGDYYTNRRRTIWAGKQPWRAAESFKVIWIRPARTKLLVTGRRLDGPAQPLLVKLPCCYPSGFQVSEVRFPAPGCWEITAKAGRERLRFVVEVAAPLSAHAAQLPR